MDELTITFDVNPARTGEETHQRTIEDSMDLIQALGADPGNPYHRELQEELHQSLFNLTTLIRKINTEITRKPVERPHPQKTVLIPARDAHEGVHQMTVILDWVCPKCSGPRGEPQYGRSYDGSRWMVVNVWNNPCGHVDKYSDVRKEWKARQEEANR